MVGEGGTLNYYERHLGDYARDTGHLSLLEHGVYTILLDRYYVTESGIPADQACRLARARTDVERAAVDVVLAEFFTLIDGVWVNERAEEEIARARIKIHAAQQNGKKGGRPAKKPVGNENETQEKPSGFSLGYENETQLKAHQTPDSSITTSSQTRGGAVDKFEIHDDWQPSEHFPTDMLRAGIPESFLSITALAEFIGYWKTRDSPARHTQAQWDHKFLHALINTKNKSGVGHANGSSGTRTLTSHERVMRANSAAAAGR